MTFPFSNKINQRKMTKLLLLFILFMLFNYNVLGLHWELYGSSKQCFIEETIDGTKIFLYYNIISYNELNSNEYIEIEIIDPDGYSIHKNAINKESGKYGFVSEKTGDYILCFNYKTNSYNKNLKKMLIESYSTLNLNDMNNNELNTTANVENLSELELNIKKLLNQIKIIRSEQSYQKAKEKSFRNISKETNKKVITYSIIQTFILILCGIFQIYHLTQFFKEKKLI